LIELLVVVAIIALLISILLPSLARARDQAKRVYCANSMHQVGIALVSYASDHKGGLPRFVNDGTKPDVIAVGSTKSPQYNRMFYYNNEHVNLGHLWRTHMLRNGHLLYCPGEKDPTYMYESYTPFPTSNTFSGKWGPYIRVAYNYNPWVKVPLYEMAVKRTIYASLADYERLYPSLDKMPPGRTVLVDILSQGKKAFSHVMGNTGGFNIMQNAGSVLFKRTSRSPSQLANLSGNYSAYLVAIEDLEKGLAPRKGR
jgi:competence protein ComGC